MSKYIYRGSSGRLTAAVLLALALLPLTGACQMARSAWVEEPAPTPVDTASSSSIRMAAVTPALRPRTDDPAVVKHVYTADGSVTHLPLWFEDPLEEIDGGDPAVAYVSADFSRMWCSWTRFAGNMILLPVSMVINPPWQVTVSDGVPSRTVLRWQHDATPVCCQD